jgi:4-hydroxythreonine-4-phosphate dehydrogenase
MLVVSVGCPAGIGPEVSVKAAAQLKDVPCVLVGDRVTISRAAELVGVAQRRLVPYREGKLDPRKIHVVDAGPALGKRDWDAKQATSAAGQAQLNYIEVAYELTRATRGAALVTGPVSKAMIANCGLPRASKFLGHTEWLQAMDNARVAIMCFAAEQLVVGLVTTHLPLSRVAKALTPQNVSDAIVQLGSLLRAMGHQRPNVLVCSVNPHAGESELLGNEEKTAIVPGIAKARRALGSRVTVTGPVGAETAIRKAYGARGKKEQPGVVAMYHDQATIPMKMVAFGDAVNVTMGLSIVRTSVDHGTAHDIAWQGKADSTGMLNAMKLAARLV